MKECNLFIEFLIGVAAFYSDNGNVCQLLIYIITYKAL